MKLVLPFLLASCCFAASIAPWRDQGVIYVDNSPGVVLHTVPVRAVTLHEGFWAPRRAANVERSLPVMLQLLEEHGVVDNFRRVSGRKTAPRRGPLYTDSDVYKWIEAAAFVLQSEESPQLQATIDRLIGEILAAQEPSGYLNTYYQDERKNLRFTEMNRSHELYCLGHLLQAAIAYYRATGNRSLLDGGIKFVDYLIATFGPGKRPLLTGHPELEMALVELYRTTGNRGYLDLAGYLLSGVERERLKLRESELKYMFSGKPFTERTVFEGHAVRAMYASSGATDYYAETQDANYRRTLDTLWEDLTRRKMYITGGVGSRSQGEAFGDPYELPNAQAYTESCAAIGNLMWNFRMLTVSGQSRFVDVMERALYNGANSGVSLDGTLYCYRNPLASEGEKIRNPWYDTTCCPPNIQRILASLPGYAYATGRDGVYVNLFHNSTLKWQGWTVEQKTEYPWNPEVAFTVTPPDGGEHALYVRIPEWSAQTEVRVNGSSVRGARAGEYFPIRRAWRAGDRVQITLDMTPHMIKANPLVAEDYGKIAVQRGPLIYCLEQPDQSAPVGELELAPSGPFTAEFRKDMLGGVLVLKHSGSAPEKHFSSEPLYEPLERSRARTTRPSELTFIPYYAWANREPSPMRVWVLSAGLD